MVQFFFYTHFNDYYDEWRDGYEDKTFAWFEDLNHKDWHYVFYLTDLENIMYLLKDGKITGTFEYINKNSNKGIRYIK